MEICVNIGFMARGSVQSIVALLCVAGIGPALPQEVSNSRSWSGTIINASCTVDEAFAESERCVENRGSGAKLSLYDDTVRVIYELDAQEQAAGHLGDSVTVNGTLQGNTIHVASIEKLTSIGLEVGHKAPAFSARDQFGREQNLDTLKGPKGTVLLFFRSADW
jgi:hypothetical protein